MSADSPSKPNSAAGSPWIGPLTSFLRQSPPSQAVQWRENDTTFDIATLGPVDERELQRCLQETMAQAAHQTTEPNASGIRLARTSDGRSILHKEHGCQEVERLWQWRQIPWPSAAETAGLNGHAEEEDWRTLAWLAGLCGLLGLVAFCLDHWAKGPAWLAPAIYVASMLAGGWDAAKDAFPNLRRGHLDIHFLMLAVATGASFIGAFGEGALLLFLFSLAGALEHFALHRTKREIDALFHLAPKTAIRLDPKTGQRETIAVDRIAPGDTLLIGPGDTFPVDGVVAEGETEVDESSLTGEARPVPKTPGEAILSGSRNLWGKLHLQCRRPARQSALEKIISLIQEARHQRAPSQRLTDRFGPPYTWGVLAATSLMFFVWWLAFGLPPFLNQSIHDQTTFSAFYRAMTLLVVASPCALVLSIPSAILAAIASGARRGILYRGGAAIEQMAGIRAVALDKTGTLTTGEMKVVAVESFPPGRENSILHLAYSLEQNVAHPIAEAIARHARQQNMEPKPVERFHNLAGRGVEGWIGGSRCLLGRRELLAEGPLREWVRQLPDAPDGISEVWFVHDETIGRFLLEDRIRPESAGVLSALRAEGLHTVMLTGDRPTAARLIGEKLGIDRVQAGLSPAGKVEAIRELQRSYGSVAMVGDGINDGPSLAAADIAVAMGARGSDVALEESDVVLMQDKIENFLTAFQLSRRARRIIHQNVVLSLGTIVIMVGAAILGLLPITLGVLAHEGSTVLVCLNSMRLLR